MASSSVSGVQEQMVQADSPQLVHQSLAPAMTLEV
jgi:hypothetical protein